MLLSNEKEWTTDSNWNNYVEWKQQIRKYMLYYSIYIKFQEMKTNTQ